MKRLPLLVGLLLPLAFAATARAQTPLTTTRVASGLNSPLYVTSPPGDSRLFIVEQAGRIKILDGGVVLPTLFLNITAKTNAIGEQGLLGLAFHPDYAENGKFFVNYTNIVGTTVVERYLVSAGDPDVADPASALEITTIGQPFPNHNGGCLQFGPDGMLYIATGDGGFANDPGCRAQDLDNRLGKLLRLDVDTEPFAIPPDNPLVGVPNTKKQVWDWGLRNPWRFTFDRLTGDLWIGDVGQDAHEEIDFVAAGTDGGVNFGWKMMEGTACTNGPVGCPAGTPDCGDPALTDPIHEYDHAFGDPVCSVTGGYVYRGCAIPDLQGTYFFADFCSSEIWSLEYDGVSVSNFTDRTSELDPAGPQSIDLITSFGEDVNGELYIVDQGGEIFRIDAASPVAGTDCDANGQIDSCEIALQPHKDLDLEGTLDVCQSFSADTAEISLASGGSQSMSLHAGAAQGGKLYWVIGTTSGPGAFPVDGVVLPLNVLSGPALDPYTLFTVTSPNTSLLSGSFGSLDAGGNGAASFNVPPAADPTLAGAVFHHAYLATTGSTFDFASNEISVTLVP